ncbi:MAG: tyrosine-type recombinase/integrase [Aureispira sp.]
MEGSISYKHWLELQHYRPRSIGTLLSLQENLKAYLKQSKQALNKSNLTAYSHWVQEQGYSSKYEQHLYWGLKSYCLYQEQVFKLELLPALPKIVVQQNIREALSNEALEQIEAWLKGQKQDYWLRQSLWSLFYGAGLRRSEAMSLQLRDLNIKEKTLSVRTVKGGKRRVLPLSNRQLESLINYVQLERASPKEGHEKYLLLGKRGGSPAGLLSKELVRWQEGTELGALFCWHVLRHSIATQLVENGMSIEQVSQFLGHKNIGSTSRYLHTNRINHEF